MEKQKEIRYKIFYNKLIEEIKNGQLKNGDKLPSERNLCEMHNISRTTVREALRKLEEEGYILRKQGDGSYIQLKPISQNLSKLYTLRSKFNEEGIKHQVKIIEFKVEKASKNTIDKLGVLCDVIKIERIFFAANVPYSIERTFLPYDKFSYITKEMIEENGLYNSMGKNHLKPTSADEYIGAKKISSIDANLLQIKKDSVVIETTRISCVNNEKIELSINTIRNDYFVYKVHLE